MRAIMALEQSHEAVYDNYSSMFALWLSSKRELAALQEILNAERAKITKHEENARIDANTILDLKTQVEKLQSEIDALERKLKRQKVASKVGYVLSAAVGFYIGWRVF